MSSDTTNALTELVAIDDLQREAARLFATLNRPDSLDADFQRYSGMVSDVSNRRPIAWAAARAALARPADAGVAEATIPTREHIRPLFTEWFTLEYSVEMGDTLPNKRDSSDAYAAGYRRASLAHREAQPDAGVVELHDAIKRHELSARECPPDSRVVLASALRRLMVRYPLRPAPRPSDDELWDQTLSERDDYHEAADKLANAIANHFGAHIGEHSSANNPWDEALEVIENAQPRPSDASPIDEMVNRFVSWPLPRDFAPDCGISFDGRKDDEWNKNKSWPTGTNLFTREQARAMFDHCRTHREAQSAGADQQQKGHCNELRPHTESVQAEQLAALLAAADEMHRISFRKHDAWDAYSAARHAIAAQSPSLPGAK